MVTLGTKHAEDNPGTNMKTKRLLQGITAAGLLSLGLGSVASGCLNRPLDRVDPRTTSTVIERLQQNGVDKIDLLLAIDNSISMGDKQEILSAALPVLVNRLVTPRCVDADGNPTGTIVDGAGECPDGEKPEFPPIRDINVGIISSSLGDLTSGACGGSIQHPDDKGRLLSRGVTAGETYKSLGFLAWDPDNKRGGSADADQLISTLGDMVVGVDQLGCGYEMQLESILRFLVDPEPYESLQVEGSKLKEVGVDQVLLDQRASFLRPDSLVAVLILSDENDCSVDVSQQGFLALKGPFFKATSECATDPNDECCTSCGLVESGSGCDAGNNCATPKYTAATDHPNLKCFDQKRRYGVNFLYPVQRYINALTQTRIDPTRRDYDGNEDPSNSVPNPLYSDLSGAGGSIRSPDLVFVAGIVGVPWQAISRREEDGTPNLALGFKTFGELQDDLTALIGDPDGNIPPTDPFMIESYAKRSGTSDILGATLPGTNPINGNDYTLDTTAPEDLQYACIFDLATDVSPGDCAACTDASCDDPLCNMTTQVNAKAYPGLRELALLRGMGSQGIFASICPAKPTGNPDDDDYGYNPAVNSIIDRLKEELGGQCLPRKLSPDQDGNVPCLVLEASKTTGECCTAPGRVEITKTIDGGPNPLYNAVEAAQEAEFADPDWNCFCQIEQLAGNEACLTNDDPQAAAQEDGWCYIDGATSPPVGDPKLVATCPPDERRLIRFVGGGDPASGSTVFITCSGE